MLKKAYKSSIELLKALKKQARWLVFDVVPWLRPLYPLLLGLLFSGIAIKLFPHSSLGNILISLQITGAFLSAGALLLSALDSQVPSPLAVLTNWLKTFPRNPLQKRTVHSGSAHGKMSGPVGAGYMTGGLGPNASQTDINAWLINELHALIEVTTRSNLENKLKFHALEQRLDHQQNQSEATEKKLQEDIRKASTTNFYQIIVGLLMVSIGSILSALLL
ncbi:hypothetical protein [Halopseudomonas oceani]|uniref:hypothetical protein n=1 Tax=Halopseudomonas oceani TaxID=1708783 RepID=UPI002AA665BB|nr:hypothetical protein [Halopseudomonas oceani]